MGNKKDAGTMQFYDYYNLKVFKKIIIYEWFISTANYKKCAIKRYGYIYKVNDYGNSALDNCKCFDEVYARICYATPVANIQFLLFYYG